MLSFGHPAHSMRPQYIEVQQDGYTRIIGNSRSSVLAIV
jgi:hypothetical protein